MGAWNKEPESLLPTAEPTREDVLFFAGFYEGEGSACGTKGGKSCIVQVPQKDPEVLYRARALWGGSIRPNGRGIHVWVMSGNRARLFLQTIYPFLSVRRKGQIEKAGAFQLSKVKNLSQSGMSPERAALRATMTETEKVRESNRVYANANYPKFREARLAWFKENRELVNQYQRERRRRLREKQTGTTPEFPERSQLVN